MTRKLPFGVKILIGVGVLVLLITFAIAFSTQPIYAGEDKTFKIFDDGVTYVIENNGGFFYSMDKISILHEGKVYDCTPDGYHNNQYLSPFCIEIIMRSIP